MDEFRQRGGVLIGTVFGEGIDLPRLDTVIMAAGGKSERLVIQRMGRALRPFDGKQRARIIDFLDQDGGMLERHSRQRMEVYRSFDVFDMRIAGTGNG